jgi:hypothetical protein
VYPDAEIGAVVLSADALEIELVLSPASAIDTVMRMVGALQRLQRGVSDGGAAFLFLRGGGRLRK